MTNSSLTGYDLWRVATVKAQEARIRVAIAEKEYQIALLEVNVALANWEASKQPITTKGPLA